MIRMATAAHDTAANLVLTTPTLRLCIVGDAIQEHLRRWSAYFASEGHQVDLVTFNPEVLSNYGNVNVHVIRKVSSATGPAARAPGSMQIVWRLRRLLKELQPDIVHVFSATWYAILIMTLWRGPFMVTPLGSDLLVDLGKASRLKRALIRRALKRASLVHSDGHNVRDVLLSLGVDPNRIIMATYGVDVDKFCPSPRGKSTKWATVISTRRLDPVHDVETLLRAIPAVIERFPETRFRIVGPGSEAERLAELAEVLGVARSITFLGRLGERDMIHALQEADIYVATSLSESGLAASTAEAMACEVAVINTDTGDIRQWLEDGHSGFIVPPRRPEILASRIIELIQDPARRETFAARTRALIVERNNYHTQMRLMEQLYVSLVSDAK